MRAGERSRPACRRVRPGVPPGRCRRPGRPGGVAGGARGADRASQRDGRQQRDGRAAGPRPVGRHHPRRRGNVPHRRRAGARQGAVRRGRDRPRVVQCPQGVRAQGCRRPLCPPPAARPLAAAVLGRRAGAGATLRYPADAAGGGVRRGLPHRRAGNGHRSRPDRPPARSLAGRAAAPRARVAGERLDDAPSAGQPQHHPAAHRRTDGHARRTRLVRVHWLRLLVGRGGSLVRARRHGVERRRRGPELARGAGDALPPPTMRTSPYRRCPPFPNLFEARPQCPR